MQAVSSFAIKALRVGPLPYLGVSVAIIGVGALLQLRSGTLANLDQGRTLFGVFAQIGGCVGLFGLATMMFSGLPAESRPGTVQTDVPHSARAARMDAAAPAARPPAADTSAATRQGLRVARQFGMQAIRQLARRA